MEYRGNIFLLNYPMVGVLASRLINSGSILPTLDWAMQQAKDPNANIISGFQSIFERKILRYLLDGKCGIIIVLARKMYKQLPAEYKQPLDEGRMLILSICDAPRTCKYYAQKRNEYIAQNATSLIFISLHENSSLNKIYEQYSQSKSTITL